MTDEQTDEREIALRDSKSSLGRPQKFFSNFNAIANHEFSAQADQSSMCVINVYIRTDISGLTKMTDLRMKDQNAKHENVGQK